MIDKNESKNVFIKKLQLEVFKPKDTSEIVSRDTYVLWGKKHEFTRHLIELLDDSIIHKDIVLSLTQQITGYGFRTKDENDIEDSNLKAFLETPANKLGESWNEILERTSADYYLSGMFAWELHWNLESNKLVEIYNIDFSSIASGKADENDKVNYWYHSTDWTKPIPRVTPIKTFDPEDRSETKQIYVFKKKFYGKDYYPKPDYYSHNLCKWVGIDRQLAGYKYNGLKRGFSAGFLVSLNNGEPTEDKKEETADNFLENFTGEESAKTIVVTFANDKEHATEILPIPNNDIDYGNMMEEKQLEILQAHRITDGMLLGIPSKTGFSSNAEQIKTSYELLYKNVIEPKQRIIEDKFSMIAGYFGFDVKLKIDKILPFEIQSQDGQKNNPNPNA